MKKSEEAIIEVKVRVYSVECRCGKMLEFDVSADSDSDLFLMVDEHVCEREEAE